MTTTAALGPEKSNPSGTRSARTSNGIPVALRGRARGSRVHPSERRSDGHFQPTHGEREKSQEREEGVDGPQRIEPDESQRGSSAKPSSRSIAVTLTDPARFHVVLPPFGSRGQLGPRLSGEQLPRASADPGYLSVAVAVARGTLPSSGRLESPSALSEPWRDGSRACTGL